MDWSTGAAVLAALAAGEIVLLALLWRADRHSRRAQAAASRAAQQAAAAQEAATAAQETATSAATVAAALDQRLGAVGRLNRAAGDLAGRQDTLSADIDALRQRLAGDMDGLRRRLAAAEAQLRELGDVAAVTAPPPIPSRRRHTRLDDLRATLRAQAEGMPSGGAAAGGTPADRAPAERKDA